MLRSSRNCSNWIGTTLLGAFLLWMSQAAVASKTTRRIAITAPAVNSAAEPNTMATPHNSECMSFVKFARLSHVTCRTYDTFGDDAITARLSYGIEALDPTPTA